MQEFESIVEEIHLFDGKLAVRFLLPAGVTLSFGQYLLASTADDLLPVVVLPQSIQENNLLSTPEVLSYWKVGSLLHLRGPLGSRFLITAAIKHLVCVSARDAGYTLKPFLKSGLQQNTSLVICMDIPAIDLPNSIEIQRLHMLPELVAWADMIFLDIAIDQMDEFKQILNNAPSSLPIYALIHVPMPCGGTSECGLCAVQTLHGIKLACQDGPIFDWHELGMKS